ncbi:MAG: glycosyltransferase family 4 protein [Rhodobacteraceae bacterium]|nr:glycosyltransferase family 4 protein [Paracoccaceae bacterium]
MAGPRPHILLVGGDGRPSGVPTHIVELSRALESFADVTVVSEPDEGGFSELETRHVAVPGLASRMSPASLRHGYRSLVEVIQRESADLVWLHSRLPVILGRLALARGDYVGPTALTYHGLPFGHGHRNVMSQVSKRLERRLASRCPPLEMVFLNDTQRDLMEAHLGPRADRHRRWVLGNASRLGPLPAPLPRPSRRHLVMTGRAGWQKNLEAAASLLPFLPEDVSLSMCGIGTDDARFVSKLKKLAGTGAKRLHLLGPLDDVRGLLASADGYLMTSRYEGEPIGALEAWEAGLPVILAPFVGAKALAKHPFSEVLASDDATKRADQIMRVIDGYLTDKEANSAQIKHSWALHHAPEAFAARAQNLVKHWL